MFNSATQAGNSSLPQGMTYEEAATLGLMENLDAARADYEKAIELDETVTDVYLSLADVYIRQGGYDRALEVLRNGLEKTDDDQQREKIREFEAGTVIDSSGEIQAIRNENPGTGQPEYLGAVHFEPGADLGATIDNSSNIVVVLDAGDYTVNSAGFSDLTNVTFLGTEGTRFVSYDGSEIVARLNDCKGITLKNLTMGHKLPPQITFCDQGVLWMTNTEATLENCDIFGCGLLGIDAASSDVTAVNTTVRDCSQFIMAMACTNAVFQDCVFSGNGYDTQTLNEWGMWIAADDYWNDMRSEPADAFSITFSGCQFTGNQNPTFYQNTDPDKINVSVGGCTFSGNAWE